MLIFSYSGPLILLGSGRKQSSAKDVAQRGVGLLVLVLLFCILILMVIANYKLK